MNAKPRPIIEERPGHRGDVVRKAVIHTPAATIATAIFAALLLLVIGGDWGALFGVTIIGIIAYALSFEAIAALRDLRSEPTTTDGLVSRTWQKSRVLFFGRVHYLMVQRRVFEIDAVLAEEVREGDRVEIVHWPYTNTLVSLRRLSRESASEAPPVRGRGGR